MTTILNIVTWGLCAVSFWVSWRIRWRAHQKGLALIDETHRANIAEIDGRYAQGLAWIYFGMLTHLARGIGVASPAPPPFPDPLSLPQKGEN